MRSLPILRRPDLFGQKNRLRMNKLSSGDPSPHRCLYYSITMIYRIPAFRTGLPLVMMVLMMVATVGLPAQSDIESRLISEGFAIARERQDAPEIALEDLTGNKVSLSSYRGSVVFLNFWATWCAPCRVEMPSMERLYQQLKDDQFVILAVDLQETGETVREFADELGLTFPILLDSMGIAGAGYGVSGIPTTYLVDKEGRLVARLIGSREWDTTGTLEILRELMEE